MPFQWLCIERTPNSQFRPRYFKFSFFFLIKAKIPLLVRNIICRKRDFIFYEIGSFDCRKYIAVVKGTGKNKISKSFLEIGIYARFHYIALRKDKEPFGNGGAADAESDVCKHKTLGR